jgi:hypothetical protein
MISIRIYSRSIDSNSVRNAAFTFARSLGDNFPSCLTICDFAIVASFSVRTTEDACNPAAATP